MKQITLDGGIKVGVFRKTPPDFDPFTASPAEVRAYGLPSLPDHTRHRERYRRLVTRMLRRSCFVEPQFRVHPGLPTVPDTGVVLAGPQTWASPNTSGAVITAPAGSSFLWMQSDWVVPSVSLPAGSSESFFATWIGIGGGDSALQAGFHASVSRGQTQLLPFWEWLSPQTGHILDVTNVTVRPGDFLSVILCTSQGAGSTDATIYFMNWTNSSHTAVAVQGPVLMATTAQWGAGFPFLWGGNAGLLADYGQVFFSECDAVTTAPELLNLGSADLVNLTSDGTANGAVVSESRVISGTVLQCLYLG
jgi:hypothetical protein